MIVNLRVATFKRSLRVRAHSRGWAVVLYGNIGFVGLGDAVHLSGAGTA